MFLAIMGDSSFREATSEGQAKFLRSFVRRAKTSPIDRPAKNDQPAVDHDVEPTIQPREGATAACVRGLLSLRFRDRGLYPRLAELQRSMGLSEGELGIGLIGAACGTLVSLTLAGRLVERVGHRRALLALLPALPLFYALAAHASGMVALFVGLLPAGLCIGAIELLVNLEADRVEHQGGRRIMNRAHAFWSFGFFGAGLLGALAARLGISPQWQLAG